MSSGYLIATSLELPEHSVPQAQTKDFARAMFGENLPGVERLLRAFDNTGIETRALCKPVEWYAEPHPFTEKNEAYLEQALLLSERAAKSALAQSGLEPSEIRGIVYVSTTGIATPSLDARVAQAIGLATDVARMPLWGLGCAGGAAGLARARDLGVALGGPVLLVVCELCSLTFVHGDRSKANFIATALFGDGAAAAVIVPEAPTTGQAFELLAHHAQLIPDSEDVMGWDVVSEGLAVRFARSIPGIVREVVPSFVVELAAKQSIEPSAFRHLVLHPGGAKVVDAYESALGDVVADVGQGVALARAVLRDMGNLSSVTVLAALDRFRASHAGSGELGFIMGLGPGFCAEALAFRY